MAKKDEKPTAAETMPGTEETAVDNGAGMPPPFDPTIERETPPRVLIVTTAKDGFRRGGRAWHGTIEVPESDFTLEQLEQIRAEKLLRVQVKETG
jgi:hypothetical protein